MRLKILETFTGVLASQQLSLALPSSRFSICVPGELFYLYLARHLIRTASCIDVEKLPTGPMVGWSDGPSGGP